MLDEIPKLISKDIYENKLIPLEEDFEFIFISSVNQKNMQIRYYLDYDNRNFIAFNIVDKDLEYFYIYLQLVTGKRTVDDVVVQNYIDSGIFQEWT